MTDIETLKRQTLMACDIPDDCGCDYATDTGASYCLPCIARAWQDEHAELLEAARLASDALGLTCRELHKAGGHVFASIGEDAQAKLRRVLP